LFPGSVAALRASCVRLAHRRTGRPVRIDATTAFPGASRVRFEKSSESSPRRSPDRRRGAFGGALCFVQLKPPPSLPRDTASRLTRLHGASSHVHREPERRAELTLAGADRRRPPRDAEADQRRAHDGTRRSGSSSLGFGAAPAAADGASAARRAPGGLCARCRGSGERVRRLGRSRADPPADPVRCGAWGQRSNACPPFERTRSSSTCTPTDGCPTCPRSRLLRGSDS